MKTILDIILLGEDFLKNKQFPRARREAEELIADALGMKRIDLYLNHDRPLNEKELEKCRSYFARRAKNEPPQYIAGHVSFAGVKIIVTPDVLIPRPETEILVEKMTLYLNGSSNKRLLDMCTGSGCIGIALKKRFPDLIVTLSDVCPKALQVAKQNASLNHVDVEIIESDLFANIDKSFDFFVANPPYVSEGEYSHLMKELYFEPKQALVGGVDGLSCYRNISENLFDRVKEAAWLEIGKDQGPELLSLFQKKPWKEATIEKDWSHHDRFIMLKK